MVVSRCAKCGVKYGNLVPQDDGTWLCWSKCASEKPDGPETDDQTTGEERRD